MSHSIELINKIIDLYTKDCIARDVIAKQLNISSGTVGWILKKNNIQMRLKGFQIGNSEGIKFQEKPDAWESVKCLKCGKSFNALIVTKRRFCTHRCAMSWKSTGSRHWNWKGGVAEVRPERHLMEYKDWRKAIFEKDNYCCRSCGQNGGNLHAHHILGWTKFPKLRYDLRNGITLCNQCHKWVHRRHRHRG